MSSEKRRFKREVDLYPAVLKLFSSTDHAVAEVPFFGKHIDILFASLCFRNFVAVEVKMKDWRNAFKQAALNQLGVQKSYVALPERLAQRLLSREGDVFRHYEVGLISVAETAKILIPSRRHLCFSLRHYRAIKNALANAKHTCRHELGRVTNAITRRSKALVFLQARAH